MTNPLYLIDTLAAEAVTILKMPMNTEHEVALYERGIRLAAQAWPVVDKSFAEEALAEIQAARESGRRTAEPEFMYRPPEDSHELLQNLVDTMLRLPLEKQAGMVELIQFAKDYPEPLMRRYRAAQAQAEQQAPCGPQL